MKKLTWRRQVQDDTIFLTFDDGPSPDVTPWVLEQLNIYNAKATFFCVGSNMLKHPEIFREVENNGHTIGNHTFDHLNGWKVATKDYLQNISQFAQVYPTPLFRPPYGKISPPQISALLKKNYEIVMWSILSYDFDAKLPRLTSMKKIQGAKPGQIIVFHDNPKAGKNLKYLLPHTLEHFAGRGFNFASL